MKKIISLVLALIACILISSCRGKAITKATITDNQGTVIEMTHEELNKIAHNNEAQFNKYYKFADIKVIGTVKRIEIDFGFEDIIYFEEGWQVHTNHSENVKKAKTQKLFNDKGLYDYGDLRQGDKLAVEGKIKKSPFLEISTDGSKISILEND